MYPRHRKHKRYNRPVNTKRGQFDKYLPRGQRQATPESGQYQSEQDLKKALENIKKTAQSLNVISTDINNKRPDELIALILSQYYPYKLKWSKLGASHQSLIGKIKSFLSNPLPATTSLNKLSEILKGLTQLRVPQNRPQLIARLLTQAEKILNKDGNVSEEKAKMISEIIYSLGLLADISREDYAKALKQPKSEVSNKLETLIQCHFIKAHLTFEMSVKLAFAIGKLAQQGYIFDRGLKLISAISSGFCHDLIDKPNPRDLRRSIPLIWGLAVRLFVENLSIEHKSLDHLDHTILNDLIVNCLNQFTMQRLKPDELAQLSSAIVYLNQIDPDIKTQLEEETPNGMADLREQLFRKVQPKPNEYQERLKNNLANRYSDVAIELEALVADCFFVDIKIGDKCIIELDGGGHFTENGAIRFKDVLRDHCLKNQGYDVIRISNDQVDRLCEQLDPQLSPNAAKDSAISQIIGEIDASVKKAITEAEGFEGTSQLMKPQMEPVAIPQPLSFWRLSSSNGSAQAQPRYDV